MTILFKQLFVLGGLAMIALPAAANERPLAVYNQAALARSTALPVLGETGVLDAGGAITSLRYDLSTEYHASEAVGEAVILDGETNLLTLAFRRGLARGLEWTLDIPVLHQGGGFMDGPIENWHQVFGLPDGGREQAPRDDYRYQYERDGQVLLDARRRGWDIGDVRTGLGWRVSENLALRGEAKFATGDEDHLAGGNLGGALWLDWALPFASDSRFSGFASAGASYNAKADVLADQQQRFVPIGAAGLAARITERVFILGQLYAHGALIEDSELDPFRAALQLSLGLRYRIAPDFDIDIGFQEDPIVAASPDFSFHFALSWRGNR